LLRFLLHTVALEELAISALINAEAEKVQELNASGIAGPVSAEEAIRINESVAKVIEAAERKEQQINQKLRALLTQTANGKDNCDD